MHLPSPWSSDEELIILTDRFHVTDNRRETVLGA
jgi:hypothetical protein